MVENFDKIVKDLDGGSAWQKVSDKKVPNIDEAKAYNIDLEALETVSHDATVSNFSQTKFEDWHNLDVRLIEIINSFISTSERPFFLIRDDKLVYMNQAAMLSFEISLDKEFIGSNFFSLVVKEDWGLLSENIGSMLTDSKEVVVRIKNSKGKITSAKLKAIYLPESDHFSFILMGEHKKNKNKISYSVLYDDVTGLPNFFLFEDRVQVAIVNENTKENPESVEHIAVVALNIDNMNTFKKMHIDDVVLNRLANNLVLNLPKTATVSVGLKYSFWIMLKQKNKDEIFNDINRILEVLADGVSDNFTKHELLFSMGVSCFPQNSRSSKKLMEQAIKALEANQKNHKNKYEIFGEEKI